ncbi:hypothetical protein ZIOFF_069750 [Zingiber officinale]|uniref:Protein kinase domain-containing protein n=1 Tax=Zingiber officinale TaxID=94328 RepID=A0A8J5C4K3_ZINOF|nr:hypothetical protein ZIOFF_069750 [Zingiber officinale]
MENGMEWSRGDVVGRGSFATVSLAFVHEPCRWQLPSVVAVKSAPLSLSGSLRHEYSVLGQLQGCPQIVRCFGDEVVVDEATGVQSYNLFLEFADGGSLQDAVRRSGRGLGEPTIRRHARSLLRGLEYIHARGYTHCDIKLQNILVVGSGGDDIVIADFGLAHKIGENSVRGIRGTPLYMAPESAAGAECAAPADVWALGCAVAEMASGRPVWASSGCRDPWGLLFAIGFGAASPEIPEELSEEGKDFLRRCFIKDPQRRWTAQMLLRHPFVAQEDDLNRCGPAEDESPRSVLGLSDWPSPRSASDSNDFALKNSTELDKDASFPSPADRVKEMAITQCPNWAASSSSDVWIDVRCSVLEENDSNLEETISREGCRTAADGDTEFDNVGSSATFQLSLPSFGSQSAERIDCGFDSSRIVDSEVGVHCPGLALPAHFSPVYFPMGNSATGFFTIFALIVGAFAMAAAIAAVHHLELASKESAICCVLCSDGLGPNSSYYGVSWLAKRPIWKEEMLACHATGVHSCNSWRVIRCENAGLNQIGKLEN